MTTKRFHLGDVLSITTGFLVSPSKMNGVYDLAKHLTGNNIFTHMLPISLLDARQHLFQQFPALSDVNAKGVTPETHATWLAERVAEHGEWFDVEPIVPKDVEAFAREIVSKHRTKIVP